MFDKIKKIINGVEKEIYLSYNDKIRQYQLNPIKVPTPEPSSKKDTEITIDPKKEINHRSELYKLKIAVELFEAKPNKTEKDLLHIKKYKDEIKELKNIIWGSEPNGKK